MELRIYYHNFVPIYLQICHPVPPMNPPLEQVAKTEVSPVTLLSQNSLPLSAPLRVQVASLLLPVL